MISYCFIITSSAVYIAWPVVPNVMASKVKKPPTMSKEVVLPPLDANIEAATTVPAQKPGTPKVPNDGIVKKLGRPFKTLKAVPGLKKTVELKAKARVPKKVNLKINPKNFARVLMENGKGNYNDSPSSLLTGTGSF